MNKVALTAIIKNVKDMQQALPTDVLLVAAAKTRSSHEGEKPTKLFLKIE